MQTGEEKEEKSFQPDSVKNRGILPFDTIKKTGDFEKLRKKGRALKSRHFTIYILPNKTGQSLRAGFSIGKKIGKAFQRNKIKRVLKEILRKVSIPIAIDVFIVARHNINGASYSDLEKELENVFDRFFQSE